MTTKNKPLEITLGGKTYIEDPNRIGLVFANGKIDVKHLIIDGKNATLVITDGDYILFGFYLKSPSEGFCKSVRVNCDEEIVCQLTILNSVRYIVSIIN